MGGEPPTGTIGGVGHMGVGGGGLNLNLPQNLPLLQGTHVQEQRLIYKVSFHTDVFGNRVVNKSPVESVVTGQLPP